MILIALLLFPFAASVLIAMCRTAAATKLIHVLGLIAALAAGALVAIRVWQTNIAIVIDEPVALSVDGLLRVDPLSALMVSIIVLVATLSGVYAIGYMRQEEAQPRLRLFFVPFHLFVFTMLLAVTTDNLGLMWVAIEGTTLATVFLVNLHNTHTSLEAAYKYLIISSVGIALAFLGTVLMYYAAANQFGEITLNWTSLKAAAPDLNPQIVRLAFLFILIGYGTKAGIAPMHTWLPDAHSEAPAPISAMMSGVLLNVGLYAVIRFKAVTDLAAGPEFASQWLMRFGLLSLAVGALFLLSPRNYKRMLAYSSVEHTGIICLGFAFGGYWGTFGALLHMVNHALAKSTLFLLSGNILLKYRTTDIRAVRGLLKAAPLTGLAFLFGVLALAGMPPFGLFISEFMIIRAGLEGGAMWVTGTAIAFLVVVFAGMLGSLHQMVYGHALPGSENRETVSWHLAPISLSFALLLATGLILPDGVSMVTEQILKLLGV